MPSAGRQPLAGWRNEACLIPITVPGLDLTGAPLRAQIRANGDNPVLLLDLPYVTDPNATGVRFVSVSLDANGVPTSKLMFQVAKAAMQSLPWGPQLGSPWSGAYALQISGITRMFGPFAALASPIDSDNAPAQRQQPIGAPPLAGSISSSSVTLSIIGDAGVFVAIDGASDLAALLARTRLLAQAATDALAAAQAAAAKSQAASDLTKAYLQAMQQIIGGLPVGVQLPIQATTRAVIAAMPIVDGTMVYLGEAGREGYFKASAVNCSAQVTADPLQGVCVAPKADTSGASGAWLRVRGDEIRPEWFGAVRNDKTGNNPATNLAALNACRDLGQDTMLSAGTYYTSDVLKWNRSDRRIFGRGQNYGAATFSRICLTGANIAQGNVFQFGADDYAHVVRGLACSDICFDRDGLASPSATGDAEDCAKSFLCQFATNSEIRRVRAFGSPIGFHFTQTATCNFYDGNAQLATSTGGDFSIAMLIGGYTAYPGFVGANGSLRVEGFTAFGWPAANWRAHTLVYGMPADTWLDKVEGSLGGHGIVVVGIAKASMAGFFSGAAGPFTPITTAGSCQDITISNARMDGFAGVGIYLTSLSQFASINILNPYVASSGTAFAWNQVQGRIDMVGGEALASADGQGGVDIAGTGMYAVRGTMLRGFSVPCRSTGVNGALLEPEIWQPSGTAIPSLIQQGTTQWTLLLRSRVAAA